MNDPRYLLAVVSLPFLGSIIAAALPQAGRNWASALAGTIALAGVGLLATFYPAIAGGEIVRLEAAWLPSLGLQFTLRLDGFTWLFALLVLSMGALVILYARYYMSPKDPVPRFFAFLQAFMGAMLGIVLSGNLIQLAFFLGADQPLFLLAHWILASQSGRSRWRSNGPDRDQPRRCLHAHRLPAARPDHGQL